MCSQGDVISTPAIKGTILPGITRKSVIDVARSQGFQVLVKLELILWGWRMGGWCGYYVLDCSFVIQLVIILFNR